MIPIKQKSLEKSKEYLSQPFKKCAEKSEHHHLCISETDLEDIRMTFNAVLSRDDLLTGSNGFIITGAGVGDNFGATRIITFLKVVSLI